MSRKLVTLGVAIGLVLMWGVPSFASPIPTPTPCSAPVSPTPCSGESDLENVGGLTHGASSGAAAGNLVTINIDWLVTTTTATDNPAWIGVLGLGPNQSDPLGFGAAYTVPVVAGSFIYLYQPENTIEIGGIASPGGLVTSMRLYTLAAPPTDYYAAGVLCGTPTGQVACPGALSGNLFPFPGFLGGGDDLDLASVFHPAQNGALPSGPDVADASEEELGVACDDPGFVSGPDTLSYCIVGDAAIPIDTRFGSIGWNIAKPTHHETATLWLASDLPPVYGANGLQDSAGAFGQWNGDPTGTFLLTRNPVPIPGQQTVIPEPATLVLFGGGLVALGLLRRRMTRSSSNPS